MSNRPNPPRRVNIVFFFVDDMGYGDASCLNPEGKIKTPNIDRLAAEGMKFTDAHSSSAVCSPSRYSVLTGRYNWRSTLQKGIVGVYGDLLIKPEIETVPSLLKEHGYHSACIGKWHLGQTWDFDAAAGPFKGDGFYGKAEDNPNDEHKATDEEKALWKEAFAKPTKGGPTKCGFDYYYGVDVPNWAPFAFIENDQVIGTPSEWLPERLVGNNIASHSGPAIPGWRFEDLLPTWATKADAYIKERAESDEPFFLYLPMTSPHTPLSVNEEFIGASGLDNPYADLVIETDDVFGRVLNSLETYGVADNTLVIFASDNGCAHYIGCREEGHGGETPLEPQGHFPSGKFRGYKSDAWDGGHRIPCVARWPGVIEPGSQCDEIVCLSDLMATCMEIVGATLSDGAGVDSVSLVPLFRDPATPVRDHVVHHSITGKFAIRDKQWKLVLCPGSGGWSAPIDREAAKEGLPLVQLYDMQNDPGETTNLHEQEPERVKEMLDLLKKLVADARSTPGAPQQNDAEVDIWKLDTMPSVDPRALDDY